MHINQALPFNVKQYVVTQQSSNTFSELLMLIFLSDCSLLFELAAEVQRDVFLAPRLYSSVISMDRFITSDVMCLTVLRQSRYI
jgi:hypothetical protein